MQRSRKQQSLGLIFWLLLAFATSTIGALASINAGDFYQALVRPSWAPPGWLFGPVWTSLFAMMAVSVWLVWRKSDLSENKIALTTFIVQLASNALWSWLFFSSRMGALAFFDIVVLWSLIVLTICFFWRHSKSAALLLAPYLAWVSFAAALNFSVWQLNPELLG